MKRKIYFASILLCIAIAGNSQFMPVNVDYQDPAYGHYPEFISIVNQSDVWLGTLCDVPYPIAAHTHDGGSTWEFDSIPVPGDPIISGLFAIDGNTCFYVFTDNWSGGSIWKTSDRGANWENKTGALFSEPGAYANFYAAFDANEGVAMGDPTLGYFEIQRTTDSGDSWTRVDSSLIPAILPGEMGATNVFSIVGDMIWFPTMIPDENGTYSSRCFKSIDRGQHWTASPVFAENLGWMSMDFSTSQKGVLLDQYPASGSGKKPLYRTSDGGETWTIDSLSVDLKSWSGVSAVVGFDGGFVVAANALDGYSTSVTFTPDFFSTVIVIDSNLEAIPFGIKFKDASTGWLEGTGSDIGALFKYNGVLTSIFKVAESPEKLAIVPNPTSTEALVKLPGMIEQNDFSLMIYNASGKLCENRSVESGTGWTKLDASSYTSGVYIVKVVSGNHLIASTKWIVQH
jgi:photosystem II stability/assembly factor-like uncharacterized protein